jgi:hypothetical protein|nr:MAG TPA: hypothetical protein [Caudoviricetes sp.]
MAKEGASDMDVFEIGRIASRYETYVARKTLRAVAEAVERMARAMNGGAE